MTDTNVVAASEAIEIGIAALTVWASSVQTPEPLTATTAAPFQLAASAIHDLLDGAAEDAGNGGRESHDFFVAQALVHTLDQALWNFMCSTIGTPPIGPQLAETAVLAARHLMRALSRLTPETSREVEHA